jgi:UDP-N-acetyl-D-galactosamine dehydrogenase
MNMQLNITDTRIAIIGLGYVGLPLAVAFAAKYPVTGFDTNDKRIRCLQDGIDHTLEVTESDLAAVSTDQPGSKGLYFTGSLTELAGCNVFIVTVPTPIDKYSKPDLTALYRASETVGKVLKKGDIVIYESTVYPGVTEDECVPILSKVSGLIFNTDYFAGYSPERINPGDKEHTVTRILKVTAGSTPEAADFVDELYQSVIVAGTFKATSIKVAEAAKVIENSQRDINIAFVNELSKIFNRIGIDTMEVLEAAGTKWNFLKFQPGLVGGHCIGVDPYYLAQKAQEMGYHPEIILAGRRLNDSMGAYVAEEVLRLMVKKQVPIDGAKVLILGFTFKENCSDVRNTRVIDMINEFESFHLSPVIYDPWANAAAVRLEYGLRIENDLEYIAALQFEAVILAVGHQQFKDLDVREFVKSPGIIYDVKGFLDKSLVDGRL